MANHKPKQVTLRAFRIVCDEPKKGVSDLHKKLREKLNNTNAENRRMVLNKSDYSKEEDLLSDFTTSNPKLISSTMLRIMPGDKTSEIPDNFFKMERITQSDLDTNKLKKGFIYKTKYVFLMSDKFLITDLKRNITIKRLETYINWLLEAQRGDDYYLFDPLIDKVEMPKLNEIKNIVINNENDSQESPRTIDKKIKFNTKDIINRIFKENVNYDEILKYDIISSVLVVTFQNLKKLPEEDRERILSNSLKNISDTDNVIYKTKKKGSITGTKMLKQKPVNIQTTENGMLVTQDLYQEMERYHKELIKDENNK